MNKILYNCNIMTNNNVMDVKFMSPPIQNKVRNNFLSPSNGQKKRLSRLRTMKQMGFENEDELHTFGFNLSNMDNIKLNVKPNYITFVNNEDDLSTIDVVHKSNNDFKKWIKHHVVRHRKKDATNVQKLVAFAMRPETNRDEIFILFSNLNTSLDGKRAYVNDRNRVVINKNNKEKLRISERRTKSKRVSNKERNQQNPKLLTNTRLRPRSK